MKKKAFFSGKVYECAANGSVPALSVRKYKKLQAFDDHLLLDKDEYPYDRFTKLEVSSDVLSMYYVDKAGKHAEKHVKYETFLPGRGGKKLLDLLKQWQKEYRRVATSLIRMRIRSRVWLFVPRNLELVP